MSISIIYKEENDNSSYLNDVITAIPMIILSNPNL